MESKRKPGFIDRIVEIIHRVYAKNSRIGERLAATLVSLLIIVKLVFSKIEGCINRAQKCLVSKRKKMNKHYKN